MGFVLVVGSLIKIINYSPASYACTNLSGEEFCIMQWAVIAVLANFFACSQGGACSLSCDDRSTYSSRLLVCRFKLSSNVDDLNEGPDHVLQDRSAWHHDLSRVHNKNKSSTAAATAGYGYNL